jgi:hypothetical protein
MFIQPWLAVAVGSTRITLADTILAADSFAARSGWASVALAAPGFKGYAELFVIKLAHGR